MQIGLLINSFNLGGAEKLIYDIAFEFKKQNQSAVVISMKKAETKLEKEVLAMLLENEIVVDTVSKPVGKQRLKSIFNIRKLLKKYSIDILHTNGQSPDFYGRIAAALCRKVKTVVTIHNTGGYSKKNESFLRFVTNAYTAVSDDAKGYCQKSLGIKNITTINNGIDFERYTKTVKTTDKKSFLTVGRVVPQKGYTAIAAQMGKFLEGNPNFCWYIVGETNQNKEYFESLKGLLSDRIKSQVIFTGAVKNPEEYYKKADMFILPSEWEGFGIAFIEAMAAKLPVICNRVGVILDIEKAGGTVAVIDGDIIQAINKAMSFTDEQIHFNYEYCKNNYSIAAITKEYIKIYKAVLGVNE